MYSCIKWAGKINDRATFVNFIYEYYITFVMFNLMVCLDTKILQQFESFRVTHALWLMFILLIFQSRISSIVPGELLEQFCHAPKFHIYCFCARVVHPVRMFLLFDRTFCIPVKYFAYQYASLYYLSV